MNWFFFALICLLGWGFADLFYKKGTDENDRYSHLRIAVWVGLVMGVCAFAMMPFAETPLSFTALIVNAVKYSPASLCYIISMVIGYAGLRYLQISIVSPVQNASGAMSAIFMMIYFLAVGKIAGFWDEFDILTLVGTVLIVAGVILLAIEENRISAEKSSPSGEQAIKQRKVGVCLLLSIVTFGIYYIYWKYLLIKNIKALKHDSSGCTGELLCLLFVPFYSLYWWFTRGRFVKTQFAEQGRSATGDEIVYLLLGLHGLGFISMAIMQNDFNTLPSASVPSVSPSADRKYRFGALALLFPLLYCLFDTIGTAADGIILDEEVGLGLGEIDVLILYGLTFFLAGIGAWLFLFFKEKKPYNPFTKKEILNKGTAACCEEFGQVFYVYAMAGKPVVAAPMVASYCIVSLLLGRVVLKEKLRALQYAFVAAVVIGILLLGISEGLAE